MRAQTLVALVALGLGAACGDPNNLPAPAFENVLQTVVLRAVRGTPIHEASGFSIPNRRGVRLDVPVLLDFVFDIDDSGTPVFIPVAALGASSSTFNAGFLRTNTLFEDITEAQTTGYLTTDTIPALPGDVFYVRSGIYNTCIFGLPYYGKIRIEAVDLDERAIRFTALINANCGYRSLEEGLPRR